MAHCEDEDTLAGRKIGKSAGQKLAFHGAAPVAQRSGAAQAAVSQTSTAATNTAATNSTPYGYSQTQADEIVASLNAAIADITALTTLVNEMRAALVQKGLIAGS